MTKLLFVSRILPGASSGSAVMNLDVCLALREMGIEVHYLCLGRYSHAGKDLPFHRKLTFGNCDPPPHYDSPITDDERYVIMESVGNITPDIVIADYSWLAMIRNYLPPTIERMVLLHDLRSRVIPDFEANGLFHPHHWWAKEDEAKVLKNADSIIVINDDDGRMCHDMAPGATVIRISLSSPRHFTDESLEVPGRVFYVGSSAQENVIAIGRFLNESWPRVLRFSPHASLHIAGGVCGSINPNQCRGIKLLGEISDLDAEYAEARCCIVPCFHGGGQKLKFIGALAHGRAIVANRCGIDGFPEAESAYALVADDPVKFANGILTVFQNGSVRRKLQANARKLAESRLSMTASYKCLNAYLHSKSLA